MAKTKNPKNKANNIVDKIKEANNLLERYHTVAASIAKTIVKALEDIIELKWSLIWCEAGVDIIGSDTICLFIRRGSGKVDKYVDAIDTPAAELEGKGYVYFCEILEEIFPELAEGPMKIECPHGLYLHPSIVGEVKDRLRKLKK